MIKQIIRIIIRPFQFISDTINKRRNAKKIISITFIFFILMQPVMAKGFLTGVVVGSLLSSHSSHTIVNKIQPATSDEESLFQEYNRNKVLIKNGTLTQRVNLKIRNEQITDELAAKARQSYIDSFSLKLIPVNEIILESKNPKDIGSALINRKKIRYQIIFSEDSPKSISNFDVISVNNQLPEKSNGKYYYNHIETWGKNVILVKVRDKKHHNLTFTTAYTYNILSHELSSEEYQDFFSNIYSAATNNFLDLCYLNLSLFLIFLTWLFFRFLKK